MASVRPGTEAHERARNRREKATHERRQRISTIPSGTLLYFRPSAIGITYAGGLLRVEAGN